MSQCIYFLLHQFTKLYMNIAPAAPRADAIKCGPEAGSCPSIDGDSQGKKMCCSLHNQCGTDTEHCNISLGCKKAFGSCH